MFPLRRPRIGKSPRVDLHRSRPSIEGLEARLCLTVPALSSLPGANHTIYLDFDGSVTQNTVWNSYSFNSSGKTKPTINSPAYDTDGNPSSFGASELADIQDAWARISEDYRPFQVNVTTVDPGIEALRKVGTGDTQWGIRVVITKDTEASGAGGIAYIGSFNWDSDTPAFVYTTGGKNIAEAASHEAGHSLGLAHDGTATSGYYAGHGTGQTSWAPLMGVGYYTNVTTWDKGEYYGANNTGSSANYGAGADDLAVITTQNGFGYRPDAVGDTISTAKPLTVSGAAVSATGIIERTTDLDVYSFTTGNGPVSLNIAPFTPGPNLDIKATLYDSAGNVVAVSNPSDVLTASFSLNLTAGQYFVAIDGTGVGNPTVSPPTGYSDYASLGQYTISGTVTQGNALPQLSVGDVSVNEGAGTATFTVTLSGVLTAPVTVGYAAADGTATAGLDYTSARGTLTFATAGSQTVTVPIIDDTVSESAETFLLNLSSPVGAAILDGQGQAIITDNDLAPTVKVTSLDSGKLEGTVSGGSTVFRFQVTRTGSTALDLSIPFTVAGLGGAAASASDFYGNRLPSGTVQFAAGETSKVVNVLINADSSRESNESFRLTLGTVAGLTYTSKSADATITDDDGSGGSRRWGWIQGQPLVPHRFPLPGQDPVDDDDHDHAGESAPGHDVAPAQAPTAQPSRRDAEGSGTFVDPPVPSTRVVTLAVRDAVLTDPASLMTWLPASRRIRAAGQSRGLVIQGLSSARGLLG